MAPATRPATPATSTLPWVAVRGGDAEHQARRGHDAVVGSQHRRAQPADAPGAVPLLGVPVDGSLSQPFHLRWDLNLEAGRPLVRILQETSPRREETP